MHVDSSVLLSYAESIYEGRKTVLDKYELEEFTTSRGEHRVWPSGSLYRWFWGLTQPEYRACYDFESETGASLVGVGTGRLVFSIPDSGRVVKFPRWGTDAILGDGKLQNQFENWVWNEYENPKLLPVLDTHPDGWWTIMPEADKVDNTAPSDEVVGQVQEVVEQIPEFHTDVSHQNLGWWQDDWYILDYGRPVPDADLAELGVV